MVNWRATRKYRYLLILCFAGLILGLLWRARDALLPYILALVLGYLMLPSVNRLDQALRGHLRPPRLARPLAIVVTYLVAIGLVTLFVSMVLPVISQQFGALWAARVDLIASIQRLGEEGIDWYRVNVPPAVQAQVTDNLQRVSATLMDATRAGASRTFGVVTSTVSFILGTLVIPFWLFYVLNDQPVAADAGMNRLPPSLRADAVAMLRIIDAVFSSYIRGQLLLAVLIGAMAAVGLTVLGVPFPAVLAVVAALFELLPFIGPLLGAIPAVLVAAVQSPLLGLWTAVLFLAIQQAENLLFAPRIAGKAVELHPAIIMVVLVVGNEVAGLWGMLLAVPLTAAARDLFRYLHWRLQDVPLSPEVALARLGRSFSAAESSPAPSHAK